MKSAGSVSIVIGLVIVCSDLVSMVKGNSHHTVRVNNLLWKAKPHNRHCNVYPKFAKLNFS